MNKTSKTIESDKNEKSKDGYVVIKVMPGDMEAKIRVVSPVNEGREPTYEDAIEELQKQNIIFGIDEDRLRDIFVNRIFDKDITIAKGEPPVDGIDGKIKYYIENLGQVKPKEDEKGNVDFKNIGFIQAVKKGEKIAEVIPPVEGKDGKDIFGRIKPAKKGKEFVLPRGRNTVADSSNPNVLVAAIDGCIIFKGKDIDISPVFIVQSNVDFSTGNIDYYGTLIVKGDIKSGFRVKVDGDLEVWGVIEDAEIETTGKILAKKGFLGRGKGKIKAKGDVILKFCENQTIFTEGNVIVEALLHSNIECYKKVIVKGSKGLIIGGSVMALEGIETKNAGNYHYTKTVLTAGVKNEIRKRLEEIDESMKKNEENVDKLKKAIATLIKSDKTKGGLPANKKALMRRMQEVINTIPAVQTKLMEEKQKIEDELQKYKEAKIKIKNKVYPGVIIYIQNKKLSVKRETSSVAFGLEDGQICRLNFSEG
ncbi:hypothetical protein DRQ09_07410 [candidate division KSB1 bacterium]|nr:MAG: hypothetical protein DRQ09_07410 [candidate division KSB1 bacterium]